MNHPALIPTIRRRRLAAALAVFTVAAGGVLTVPAIAGSEARVVPEFVGSASGAAASAVAPEVAVLAGGCFWGVQGVFQHVKGVRSAVSGYAGGEERSPSYESVSSGATGHAEAVQVTFDPREIGFARILQIYFSVAHDPTQLNRQGPDHGTQYRSAIFPTNPEQARVARAYIAQLDKARVFPAAVVTKVEPARAFYPAEDYHQDFLVRNPTYPYIVYNDLPKIDDLKHLFPAFYRTDPKLVLVARKGG